MAPNGDIGPPGGIPAPGTPPPPEAGSCAGASGGGSGGPKGESAEYGGVGTAPGADSNGNSSAWDVGMVSIVPSLNVTWENEGSVASGVTAVTARSGCSPYAPSSSIVFTWSPSVT